MPTSLFPPETMRAAPGREMRTSRAAQSFRTERAAAPLRPFVRSRQPNEDRFKWLMVCGLAGDPRSHTALLRAIRPMLSSYFLRRLGDRAAEAEDLVQEVLLSVHERRNSFDCARPFTPWLFAIARHKMIDHFRRLRTHEPIDYLDQRPADDNFEPAVVARLDVATLLDTLPAKQACAIRHTRLQGLSVPEAARAARIGESDVKVSAHRGIRALAARVAIEAQQHNRLDAA